MKHSNKGSQQLNHHQQLNQFLRDFDFLTTISDEDQILYQKSNLSQGLALLDQTYVRDHQNAPFSLTCSLEAFKKFGPGIYLLFKFLKFSTILFGIAAVLSVINISILASNDTEITHIENNGLKNTLLKATLANAEEETIGVVQAFNIIIILVISIGMIYWSEQEKQNIHQCLKQKILPSYYTVVLKSLPQNYNQLDMKNYLSRKYGPIVDIYTVRNFEQDLLQYKEMSQIVEDYKIQKSLHELDQAQVIKSNKLARLFLYFKNGHLKMKKKIQQNNHYQFCFAFIQFQSPEHRDNLLQDTNKTIFNCISDNFSRQSIEDDNQHIYNRNDLKFEQCEMEPDGILWENLHLSASQKMLKSSLLFFLMLAILAVSVFLISSFSAVQMGIYNTVFTKMTKTQILSLSDQFALLSFCLKLSLSDFNKESGICGSFKAQYIKISLLILLIPVSISLFRFLLTQLMKLVVAFRRYSYEIRKIESQAIILFIFYFLVTGGVQIIVYLSFGEKSSFLGLFSPLIRAVLHDGFSAQQVILTTDFTPDWYLLAATNIILIGALSFNLSALGIIFYCKIRSQLCQYFAKKQELQIQMNKWLQGYQLQIEYIYASILTIFFFTFLFSGCIPLLYPLAFIAFFIQYWAYKYVFVRFCAKPIVFNHSINRLCRNLIFIGLIMHCLVTPSFFRTPGIAGQNQQLQFFQKIVKMWYYLLIIGLLISYKIVRKPLLKVWTKYQTKLKKNEKKSEASEDIPSTPIPAKQNSIPSQIKKSSEAGNQSSYSIHNSPYLKKSLLTLYTINNKERSRKTCLLNKQLLYMYEDSIKGNKEEKQELRSLFEVIRLVRRDFKEYEKSNKKGRNPYESIKKKLYQIYLNCKGSKVGKFTINSINYGYDQMDYVCEKFERESENKTSVRLNPSYDRYIQEENKKSKSLEQVAEEESNQVSEQKNIPQIDNQQSDNIHPQISQNRLISDQKI